MITWIVTGTIAKLTGKQSYPKGFKEPPSAPLTFYQWLVTLSSKTISVNGYGFEHGIGIALASVKINPRGANNVKITVAFPLDKDTRVNWLWKGDKSRQFHQAALELLDRHTLVVNLQNNSEWLNNGTIEQIGLYLPADNTSLTIEKIEL